MARSNMRVSLPYETEEVWNVVTSLDSYGWRSDLSKIEIVNDTTFIEYTKNGYATIFTVTAREPLKRWEFDMENENMRGHWIGLFFRNGNETTVDFTETVTVKKLFMKPLAGVYLKKQQALYVKALESALRAKSRGTDADRSSC